jgi:hypothetical protein
MLYSVAYFTFIRMNYSGAPPPKNKIPTYQTKIYTTIFLH